MLRLSLALQPSAAFRPSFLRPACRAASEFNFKAYNTLRAFSAFTMAPNSASEVPKWVDGLVEEHKITVFSKRCVVHHLLASLFVFVWRDTWGF